MVEGEEETNRKKELSRVRFRFVSDTRPSFRSLQTPTHPPFFLFSSSLSESLDDDFCVVVPTRSPSLLPSINVPPPPPLPRHQLPRSLRLLPSRRIRRLRPNRPLSFPNRRISLQPSTFSTSRIVWNHRSQTSHGQAGRRRRRSSRTCSKAARAHAGAEVYVR